MKSYFISGDPVFRAAVKTDDGHLVAFRHAPGGKVDGTQPEIIEGFHALDDNAGISERSHLGDPTLERIASTFTAHSISL